jgi:uncharacterized membrane protein YtjA (UPF0391 family)
MLRRKLIFGTESVFRMFLFQNRIKDDAKEPKLFRRIPMLGGAVTFLVVALIAALFGFGGIASASAGIAQILFVVFLILFVIAAVAGAVRGRSPRL